MNWTLGKIVMLRVTFIGLLRFFEEWTFSTIYTLEPIDLQAIKATIKIIAMTPIFILTLGFRPKINRPTE